MHLEELKTILTAKLTDFGLMVIGAIVIWAIGRWLITFACNLIRKGLNRQKIDTNMAIRELLGGGAFPAPVPSYAIKQLV